MKLRQKKFFVSLVCLLSLIYLGGSAFADNILTNGSFEAGNSGFTSAYTYGGLGAAGHYTIGDNPQDYNALWGNFGPQDGSLMMIVNGATNATTVLWSQTVGVTPNTDYDLSFWVASSYPNAPAVLQLSIGPTILGSIAATSTKGEWVQFSTTWNSGSNTTASLSIVDLTTWPTGNDFCLDNMRMDGPDVVVPLPGAIWLLGSGLLGLGGYSLRRRRS